VAIDPVDAVVDALATYFAGLSGIASALRGWPEHPEALDLTAGPVVTVTAVDHQRARVVPTCLASQVPPALSTWKLNELTITLQLDVWAAYRSERDDAGAVIEAGLHNSLPQRHGLYLTSTGYYDRPFVVSASDGRSMDDGDGAEVGEWRRRWLLQVVTDTVVLVETPQQLELVLRGLTTPDTTVS
jgi:hypothetical protein